MRYYVIYKITNLVNNKIYIGQSINYKNRWRREKYTAFDLNDDSYDLPLYRAFRKYGFDKFDFSIIEDSLTVENVEEREIYWIAFYKTNIYRYGSKFGYNLTDGGFNPIIPTETRNKISKKSTGREVTAETRRLLSRINTGRKQSKETCQKISLAKSGKKQSKETIKKRADKLRGQKRTQEQKNKLSITKRGELNHQSKLTENIVLDIRAEYETTKISYKDLAKKHNVALSTISDIIKKRTWNFKS